MDTVIRKLLNEEKIEYAGIIPFKECKVINQPLLDRSWQGKEPRSVIMISVPYFSGEYPERNVSLYAIARDYHLYFKELYERMIPKLSEEFPVFYFRGFSDNSPIGEIGAAAKAGLGIIGDKFQLINEKYGAYTFIGEILTDKDFDCYDLQEIKLCDHCGACSRACPVKDGCLSGMTQKKGEIDSDTAYLIRKTGIVWGCDICRTACPMNKKAAITPISFFLKNLMPQISVSDIRTMSKKEFGERAYSWRGRKTILRNLSIYESVSEIGAIPQKDDNNSL